MHTDKRKEARMTTKLTATLPPDLMQKVVERAKREDRSVSSVVRRALVEFFGEQKTA